MASLSLSRSPAAASDERLPPPLALMFEEAVRRAGGAVEATFEVDGRAVRTRFAGAELGAAIAPALMRRCGQRPPELTIYRWSGGLPPVPDELTVLSPPARRFDVWRAEGGEPELVWCLLRDGKALVWTAAAQPDPGERAAPFVHVLGGWLAGGPAIPIHAGAVASADRAALLVGRGGSGKSTVALQCAGDGLAYLGDDYVLLDSERLAVEALYRSGKLARHAYRHVSARFEVVIEPAAAGEKLVVAVDNPAPGPSKLRAIVAPTVVPGAPTSMRRISAARALAALAPSTIFQLRAEARAAFDHMASVCASLPAYALRLGTNSERVPGLIRSVLE